MRLAIDVSSIVIHKTNKPDIVVNFFAAAGLAGKDHAEVNFSAAQTNAAAISDDDGLIVKRTIDNRCRAFIDAEPIRRFAMRDVRCAKRGQPSNGAVLALQKLFRSLGEGTCRPLKKAGVQFSVFC